MEAEPPAGEAHMKRNGTSVKLSKREQEEFDRRCRLIDMAGGHLEPMRAMRPLIIERRNQQAREETKS